MVVTCSLFSCLVCLVVSECDRVGPHEEGGPGDAGDAEDPAAQEERPGEHELALGLVVHAGLADDLRTHRGF